MSLKTKMCDNISFPPLYQNPFMAPNGLSEIHFDSFQSNLTPFSGSLSDEIREKAIFPPTGIASGFAFNQQSEIITIRTYELTPQIIANDLLMFDPVTFRTLSKLSLPPRPHSGGPVSF